MHCPLGVVFVGLGVSEIDEQPIAQIFGDMALEAGRGPSIDFLVAPDDVPKFFGV